MKKYLLITSNSNKFGIKLPEEFLIFDVDPLFTVEDENDYLFITNRDEYYLNAIATELDKKENDGISAVIVNENLGTIGWARTIGLAGHIACTKYMNCNINSVPIIVTGLSDLDISEPGLYHTIIGNMFLTKGFYFRKYENLLSLKYNYLSGDTELLIDSQLNKMQSVDVNTMRIIPPTDQSHQSTNEWGAMRLAKNFGLFDKITFKYPRHLYFKYLANFLTSGNQLIDSSLHGIFKRVLLIDDNAGCGWKELLEVALNCKVDIITDKDRLKDQIATDLAKFETYDLILLDLYLEKSVADSTVSISSLKQIKSRCPQVPLIMFTASEKALNLSESIENGADAMFIKESPLHYKNEAYSKRNFEQFKNIILEVSRKYAVLRPYWTKIQETLISDSFLAIENSPRLIQERIEERLRMFYGLLKKGYEQREYDKKTFYYSEYELAFMTLWSVLNEIQESSFIKLPINFPIKDSLGITYNHHPKHIDSKKIRIGHYRWLYKKDNTPYIDFYIVNDTSGNPLNIKYEQTIDSLFYDIRFYATFDQKFSYNKVISRNDEVPPFFQIIAQVERQKELKYYEEKIILQIAFVIEKINPSDKLKYYSDLIELNKLRNSLYLTHGNSTDPAFYIATEATKRTSTQITPERKIADLFNLVYLLLTEDDSSKIIL